MKTEKIYIIDYITSLFEKVETTSRTNDEFMSLSKPERIAELKKLAEKSKKKTIGLHLMWTIFRHLSFGSLLIPIVILYGASVIVTLATTVLIFSGLFFFGMKIKKMYMKSVIERFVLNETLKSEMEDYK